MPTEIRMQKHPAAADMDAAKSANAFQFGMHSALIRSVAVTGVKMMTSIPAARRDRPMVNIIGVPEC